MENDPNIYNVDTAVMVKKINRWRLDYVDHINTHIASNSFLDQRTVAEFLTGQVNDTQILMQWCETLAYKVEQLEKLTNPNPHESK
jgi:hypothetical protein